jgi:hypothetical protein
MKHAAYYSTLKMGVTFPSETSVEFHRTIRRYILEDFFISTALRTASLKSRYCVHTSLPADPASHTVTPFHNDRSIHPSTSLSPNWSLPFRYSDYSFVCTSHCPCMLHVPSILSSSDLQSQGTVLGFVVNFPFPAVSEKCRQVVLIVTLCFKGL